MPLNLSTPLGKIPESLFPEAAFHLNKVMDDLQQSSGKTFFYDPSDKVAQLGKIIPQPIILDTVLFDRLLKLAKAPRDEAIKELEAMGQAGIYTSARDELSAVFQAYDGGPQAFTDAAMVFAHRVATNASDGMKCIQKRAGRPLKRLLLEYSQIKLAEVGP